MTTAEAVPEAIDPILASANEQTRKDLALLAVLDWLTVVDRCDATSEPKARFIMRERMAEVFPERFTKLGGVV